MASWCKYCGGALQRAPAAGVAFRKVLPAILCPRCDKIEKK